VRVRSADGFAEDLYGAGVILATPAPVAAGLTESVAPDLSRQLRSIAYYPVALIVAEYDRPIFSSKVRALIFDSNDVLSNAGAYGINDLNLVRYTFSGKASREYVSNAGDAESLLRMGEESLSRHIAVDPSWRKNFVMRRFNLGLCAYTPYHAKFLDSVDQERSKLPGLYLTGDYIRGASIEGCFRSAAACVTQLIQDQTQKAPVRAPALELQTQS
jgi:oxygen-dependent protoporphyrinogen oxidase